MLSAITSDTFVWEPYSSLFQPFGCLNLHGRKVENYLGEDFLSFSAMRTKSARDPACILRMT